MSLGKYINQFLQRHGITAGPLKSYDDIFKALPAFRGLDSDEILHAKNYSEVLLRDAAALKHASSNREYQSLEQRMIGQLEGFKSGQSYGSVAFNSLGDRFASIIEYIDLIRLKFDSSNLKFAIDPKKVDDLITAVIKSLAGRVGNDRAGYLVPTRYLPIYKRVMAKSANRVPSQIRSAVR